MNQALPLLALLFDPEDETCFAKDVREIEVYPAHQPPDGSLFYTINPLTSYRRDDNVTKCRNILCEFDQGSVAEQIEIIRKSGIPYSALVHSGNKSIHLLISLTEPVERVEYQNLVRRIYAKLPNVDRANSNPSRLSRLPGVVRPETGKRQHIVGGELQRIGLSSLNKWLGPEPHQSAPEPNSNTIHHNRSAMSGYTLDLLMFGAEPGTRNNRTFAAACDLIRCGYSESEVLNMISEAVDLSLSEIKQCIRSANKAVRGTK